ncbi:hypothetical protein PBY51_017011 [Eleginops maclovinus]|uniref:Uncharacterized protein n=1 Tax=Eleginops maclovinus TaxID=56733 RepID=A0AAN7WS09_ELEMC|nr:hypothetical protein PBY51_017011 [Eleginops maclovinus]
MGTSPQTRNIWKSDLVYGRSPSSRPGSWPKELHRVFPGAWTLRQDSPPVPRQETCEAQWQFDASSFYTFMKLIGSSTHLQIKAKPLSRAAVQRPSQTPQSFVILSPCSSSSTRTQRASRTAANTWLFLPCMAAVQLAPWKRAGKKRPKVRRRRGETRRRRKSEKNGSCTPPHFLCTHHRVPAVLITPGQLRGLLRT